MCFLALIEFCGFCLWPLSLISSCLWMPLRRVWLCLLYMLLSDICTDGWDPLSLLFPRLNAPSLPSLSWYETCSSSSITFLELHWISSSKSISFLYPGLDPAPARTQHSRYLTGSEYRGKTTSFYLLAMLILMQPTIPLAFSAARAHYCLMTSLVTTRTPRSPLPSSFPADQLVLFLPRGRTLLFSSLKLRFLQPVEIPLDGSTTFWCINHSSQICIICKPEGALFPISHITNDTGLSIDPWSTPAVTGLQLDFVLLITILWARQFSQVLIHFTVPTYLGCTSWVSSLRGW